MNSRTVFQDYVNKQTNSVYKINKNMTKYCLKSLSTCFGKKCQVYNSYELTSCFIWPVFRMKGNY